MIGSKPWEHDCAENVCVLTCGGNYICKNITPPLVLTCPSVSSHVDIHICKNIFRVCV